MARASDNRRLYLLLTVLAILVFAFRTALTVDTIQKLTRENAPPLEWTITLIGSVAMPYFCLLLGFRVAYARPHDPLAWMLVGLMISFSHITSAGGGTLIRQPAVRMAHLAISSSWPIWMFLFGLRFPEPFPWERRFTWLKWTIVGVLILGIASDAASALEGRRLLPPALSFVSGVIRLSAVSVFFMCLGWKSALATNVNAKRRLKLLWTGTSIGLLPTFVYIVYHLVTRQRPFTELSAAVVLAILCLPLFPLTLAYVIFVHRAFDVRMTIRQGVKYALARGMVRLAVVVFMVTLVALLSWMYGGIIEMLRQSPIIVPAVVLIGLGMRQVRGRVFEKIDQRFFREAYKAEHVLGELSESVRSIVGERQLLETVAKRVAESLHVQRIAMLLQSDGQFSPAYTFGFEEPPDATFPASSPIVHRMLKQGVPPQIDPEDTDNWIHGVASLEIPQIKDLQAQLLLPIAVKNRMLGFMSLGSKRSEEPYSRSDISLLQSVAAQTALALENSRLTETIAAEAAQRERLNREIEIAREVQQRLFPSDFPKVKGLEYAGTCRPALFVGGDYFDFLAMPKGDFGVAVGDVSGKGIGAALLMAALQASVRGQTIEGGSDLAKIMRNVNRLLYDATPPNRYATLFYGHYEADTRRLHYVNAGHNSPVVVRKAGAGWEVFTLDEGGLSVGLFKQAVYQPGTIQLQAGDVLVAFTDGLSEAMNPADAEWGEERLVEAIETNWSAPPAQMMVRLIEAADRFAAGAPQHDDMTVVVLRVS
jgi:sigma-B regulation protein RsbU (phosphoserine phosphatase)